MTVTKKESTIKQHSITDFINTNYHLITIIGVFGAISGFFITIEFPMAAIVSLGLLWLTGYELAITSKFDKTDKWSLIAFRVTITYLFILSISLFILEYVYRKHSELTTIFTMAFLLPVFMGILSLFCDKDKIERFFRQKFFSGKYQNSFQKFLKITSFIIFFECSIILAMAANQGLTVLYS